MPQILSGADHATFINTFRCAPSNQDEVVRINIDIVEQVASAAFEPHECVVAHVAERG
jgi:hypothetical protein